jgi:hypothetical protein
VSGDECAHAFSVPDDFCFRVAFFDELGEGVEVGVPLFGVSDVTTAVEDGIAALAANFVGVNGGVWLSFDDVICEIGIVCGSAAEAVDADDDDVLVVVVAFPDAVAEGIGHAAFGGWVVDEGDDRGAAVGKEKNGEKRENADDRWHCCINMA